VSLVLAAALRAARVRDGAPRVASRVFGAATSSAAGPAPAEGIRPWLLPHASVPEGHRYLAPTAEAPDLKAEPALSVYWQHRAGLEQVLAQERQG
jgi:hypothetical protein